MRTSILLALLALTLGTACHPPAQGITGASSPPPLTTNGASVQRWEHYCVYPGSHTEELVRAAGELGWEMVGLAVANNNQPIYCFKRPLPEGVPATRLPVATPVPDEEFPALTPTVEPAPPTQP